MISPLLFNIYVDDLISQLADSNLGYYIGCTFYGCITYADDILLLSVSGLQSMLDKCNEYGCDNCIFNSKKSVRCVFGHCANVINSMK